MTVVDSRGVSVWPGPVAYSCPEMGAVDLRPGARIFASGTWPVSVAVPSIGAAPVGRYRLRLGPTLGFTVVVLPP